MSNEIKKTKVCKSCKTEIPKDAKVCPNCKKRQGLPVWAIIVIVIVALGIIGGIAGGNDSPKSENKKEETSKSATKKSEKKTLFDQDEVVDYNGVKYSVLGVEKTTSKNYDEAKSGKEFVIVKLKIENKSDKKISYNPYDWKMENGNGQIEDNAFTTADNDTSLNSGELNPGGKVEGTIAFEEPIGDENLKILYYNTVINDKPEFQIKIN